MAKTKNNIDFYIDFIENQIPGLKYGDYDIKITQTFQSPGIKVTENFENSMKFSVKGERFNLKQDDIICVFPPAGGSGEYTNVLPHIVLKRNTLPWERIIAKEGDIKLPEATPWMALLVFNEDELKSENPKATKEERQLGKIMTVRELRNKGVHTKEENGENTDENVTVIFAEKKLLDKMLLPASELSLLTHARNSSLRVNFDLTPEQISSSAINLYYEINDTNGNLVHADNFSLNEKQKKEKQVVLEPGNLKPGKYKISLKLNNAEIKIENPDLIVTENDELGNDVGIVVANRLPKIGKKSIVHLVSLEDRYKKNGNDYTFNFGNASKDDSLIPLVSLKSWSFYSDSNLNFKQLLSNLVKINEDNTLRLPVLKDDKNEQTKKANEFLMNGYLPLPHYFRFGGKSMSWYRGPFAPGITGKSLDKELLPAACSDALLMYDEEYGMLDVTYGAAWELGRLMALRDVPFSTRLCNWKKLHRSQMLQAGQQTQNSHLPFMNKNLSVDLPDDINNWLINLSLLKNVPFNYFVPDERMLPQESIRFFCVDREWITCLIDGAFSIGRMNDSDKQRDKILIDTYLKSLPDIVSGFLIRSQVVSGWPTMQIDAYKDNAGNDELPMLRMDRLSPNVLLCLFKGEMNLLEVYQKPEMIHFGFAKTLENKIEKYSKKFGKEEKFNLTIEETDRLINVIELKNKINDTNKITSAQFAFKMVEGVEKVQFFRK